MKTPKFDDDFPEVPTRKGVAPGKSIERRMLETVGGSDSFRTVIRNNPDGTTTMLRTRGGWPSFTTSEPKIVTEGSMLVYLESGVLSALTNVDYPANWNGLNIVGEGAARNFHKWVEATADKLGDYNSGALYPGPSAATFTAIKKNLALKIPASVFSGKMRLFMQAQYGSAEATGYSLIERGLAERSQISDVVGTLQVCKYPNRMASTYEFIDDFRPNVFGVQYGGIELGFMADNSCGIFTSSGYYWLISIVRAGTVFTVKAYPLAMDEKVAEFSSRLATLYANPDQAAVRKSIAQCEAYLFAYATPVVADVLTLGTFDLGADGLGDPIAYGWKFNSLGSEAKMVIHHLTPTMMMNMRWSSRTLTMSLAFAPNTGPITAGNFTCSITAQNNGVWVNPNGVLLYAPCFEGYDDAVEYPTRLHITSIASPAFSGSEPPDSTDTPIYGFYIGNVWNPLTMSRATVTSGMTIKNDASNCWDGDQYIPAYETSGEIDDPTGYPVSWVWGHDGNYSVSNQSQSRTWVALHHAGTKHDLKFNGQTKSGRKATGTGPDYWDTKTVETANLAGTFAGSGSAVSGYSVLTSHPSNDAIASAIASWTAAAITEDASVRQTPGAYMNHSVSIVSAEMATFNCERSEYKNEHGGNSIAAVIPVGDSEAVLLLKEDGNDQWVQIHHSTTTNSKLSKVTAKGTKSYHYPPNIDYSVNEDIIAGAEFLSFGSFASGTNDLEYKPLEGHTESSTYLTKAEAKQCTKNPEYDLFWRPQTAYYDPGMYSMTSVLDHFNCSEGLRSDSGMDVKQRFCGWI